MAQFRTINSQFSASGQISLQDVSSAADQGFKAIICNRPDDEDIGQINADEVATACKAAGLAFSHIPVVGGMTRAQVDDMAAALETAGGPVLAYCRSGTRSTNIWALAMAANGEDPDALVEAGAKGGYDLNGLLPTLRALKAT